MIKYLLIYFAVINMAAFFIYGIDKSFARKKLWRISEKTLLLFAVFGGSIGALLGMFFFHHKTKHLKFILGVPAILILQMALTLFLYKSF